MEFLTLEASDYESALRKARSEYGASVRVHTRKDFQAGPSLRPQKRCRITFYLVQEPKAEEPPVEEVFDPQAHLEKLVGANALEPEYHAALAKALISPQKTIGKAELEVGLLEALFDTIQFESKINEKFLVLVGNAGVGKTTTLIKLALNLRGKEGKKVALLSSDIQRPGAMQQVRELAKVYALELYEAVDGTISPSMLGRLQGYDHVLVDTSGRSEKDDEQRTFHMMDTLSSQDCRFLLAVSASSKLEDLLSHRAMFSDYNLGGLVVTKLDETHSIGNILSFIHKTDLALYYLTDGQAIPEDFHRADASVLVPLLQGFSLDLSQFFPSI